MALVSAVLLCAELAAAGELGAVAPRDDINSALLYWQAFDRRVELPADIRTGMFAEPPSLALAEAEPHVLNMTPCLRAFAARLKREWRAIGVRIRRTAERGRALPG